VAALRQSCSCCDAPAQSAAPGAKSRTDRVSALTTEELRFREAIEAQRHQPDLLTATSQRFALLHRIGQMLRDPATGRGPAVCGCGRSAFGADGEPVAEVSVVRREGGGVAIGGVYRCGSGWLCPVCAPGQTIERQRRVADAVAALYKSDGVAVMVTLTARHRRGDRLADLKEIVQTAGRKSRQGRAWVEAQKTADVVGVIVAPEVTYSLTHGWHFHLHLLVLCRTESDCIAKKAGEFLVSRYLQNIKAAGARARRLSQDVQVAASPADAADYVAKGLAWELSGRTKKVSRSAKGLQPFEIAMAAAAGDEKAFALWREYASAIVGTRSCVISQSLADALALKAADGAEEVAQQFAEDGEIVGSLPAATWNALMRLGRASELVEKVEARQPWAEIAAWAKRIAHPPPPADPPPEQHEIDYARIGRHAAGWGSASTARALRDVLDFERREAERRGHVFTLDVGQLQAAVVAAAGAKARKPAMGGPTNRTAPLAKGSKAPVEPHAAGAAS